MSFDDKLAGALYGTAIGDGMGGPVEGWESERIMQQFAGWDFGTFIPPQEWLPKGDGHITDDTLMLEALIRAYQRKGAHFDAYDFRDYLIAEYVDTEVWLPEFQRTMPLLERMNSIEKYALTRLRYHHADPRTAGIGNAIHCGLAMFILPVGAVNVGRPIAAYQEAVTFGMAETTSFAVEAAAVLAAANARGMAADGTIANALAAAQDVARDGTALAITQVLAVVDIADSLLDFIAKVRAAFLPFDPKSQPAVPGEAGEVAMDMNVPSTRLSIEELPVALAALAYGDGDFLKTLRAAVCYGRDCDSIAGMAVGLFGSIYGASAIPESLRNASNTANQRDYTAMAATFATTIRWILAADLAEMVRARESV